MKTGLIRDRIRRIAAGLTAAVLTLAAPVAAHTAFDAVLMVMEVAPALTYVLFAAFFFLVHHLYRRSSRHIADLLARDEWQKGREVFKV